MAHRLQMKCQSKVRQLQLPGVLHCPILYLDILLITRKSGNVGLSRLQLDKLSCDIFYNYLKKGYNMRNIIICSVDKSGSSENIPSPHT